MPLEPCSKCETLVSDHAAKCPRCGCPDPAEKELHARIREEATVMVLSRHLPPRPLVECPECGASLVKGTAHFNLLSVCTKCGHAQSLTCSVAGCESRATELGNDDNQWHFLCSEHEASVCAGCHWPVVGAKGIIRSGQGPDRKTRHQDRYLCFWLRHATEERRKQLEAQRVALRRQSGQCIVCGDALSWWVRTVLKDDRCGLHRRSD
jgi:hypothetical protein